MCSVMEDLPSFVEISSRHSRIICDFISEQILRNRDMKLMMHSNKSDVKREEVPFDKGTCPVNAPQDGPHVRELNAMTHRPCELPDEEDSDVPLNMSHFDTPEAYSISKMNHEIANSRPRDGVCSVDTLNTDAGDGKTDSGPIYARFYGSSHSYGINRTPRKEPGQPLPNAVVQAIRDEDNALRVLVSTAPTLTTEYGKTSDGYGITNTAENGRPIYNVKHKQKEGQQLDVKPHLDGPKDLHEENESLLHEQRDQVCRGQGSQSTLNGNINNCRVECQEDLKNVIPTASLSGESKHEFYYRYDEDNQSDETDSENTESDIRIMVPQQDQNGQRYMSGTDFQKQRHMHKSEDMSNTEESGASYEREKMPYRYHPQVKDHAVFVKPVFKPGKFDKCNGEDQIETGAKGRETSLDFTSRSQLQNREKTFDERYKDSPSKTQNNDALQMRGLPHHQQLGVHKHLMNGSEKEKPEFTQDRHVKQHSTMDPDRTNHSHVDTPDHSHVLPQGPAFEEYQQESSTSSRGRDASLDIEMLSPHQQNKEYNQPKLESMIVEPKLRQGEHANYSFDSKYLGNASIKARLASDRHSDLQFRENDTYIAVHPQSDRVSLQADQRSKFRHSEDLIEDESGPEIRQQKRTAWDYDSQHMRKVINVPLREMDRDDYTRYIEDTSVGPPLQEDHDFLGAEKLATSSSSTDLLIKGSKVAEGIRGALHNFLTTVCSKQTMPGPESPDIVDSLEENLERQYLEGRFRRKLARRKQKLEMAMGVIDKQMERILSLLHKQEVAPPGGAEASHYCVAVNRSMFMLRGMISELIMLANDIGASQTACATISHICPFLQNLTTDQISQSPNTDKIEEETLSDEVSENLRSVKIEITPEAVLSPRGLQDVLHGSTTRNTPLSLPVHLRNNLVTTDVTSHAPSVGNAEQEVHREKSHENVQHILPTITQQRSSNRELSPTTANTGVEKANEKRFLIQEEQGCSVCSPSPTHDASCSLKFPVGDMGSKFDCDICRPVGLPTHFPKQETLLTKTQEKLYDAFLFLLLLFTFLMLMFLVVRNHAVSCGDLIWDRDVMINMDLRHTGVPTW